MGYYPGGGGGGGGAPTAPVSITGTNPASVPLTVTGAASQAAHLFDVDNAAGTPQLSVLANGNLKGPAGGGFSLITDPNYDLHLTPAGAGHVYADALIHANAGIIMTGNGISYGTQGSPAMYGGPGAPNIPAAPAGSFYFRTDTPGTANQRIYVATATNTWTGIV